MSLSATNIERVVREVLAELGVAPTSANGKAPKVVVPAQESSAPSHSDGDLRIESRVVTMNDIIGRLDSVRRVVVERKSIVTPAVRDELIRRGIGLGHSDSCGGRPVAAARLVIMTCGTKFDPAALAAGLARENLKIERTASDCIIAGVDRLAAEVLREDTLGALLTPHTAAALCLANRVPSVRAVTGRDAPSVATAAAAVGANVLVVDPELGTYFQLKQIVTEFSRCGARPCPEVLAKRLA